MNIENYKTMKLKLKKKIEINKNITNKKSLNLYFFVKYTF